MRKHINEKTTLIDCHNLLHMCINVLVKRVRIASPYLWGVICPHDHAYVSPMVVGY